ncbi:molybdate ABC transporter substrate-binding protein [Marinobacter sp.]
MQGAQAGGAMVAVAANFTTAARELAREFEARTDHTVKMSFGSTGKLYAQIANGAPYEVFLAGDTERPALAVKAGLADPDSRFTYATGRLVLWSPRSHLFEDGESYLREADFQRLAIGNPATAPYGLAAFQALSRLNLWADLSPKLVRGESIAQTFQFVATGNVETGFVALAQLQEWSGESGTTWAVPEHLHEPIAQQAVLLHKGLHSHAARAWLEFLRSPEALAIIEQYGYGVALATPTP